MRAVRCIATARDKRGTSNNGSQLACVPPRRKLLNIDEELEDLLALLAVAMNIAPEHFPSWSDGPMAHMAALSGLWAEVRPHLKVDAAEARCLDEKLRRLLAAFNEGETDEGMCIAGSLYVDIAGLR